MNIKEIAHEQIKLLAEWNKEHAQGEPEQARRNAETIMDIFVSLCNLGYQEKIIAEFTGDWKTIEECDAALDNCISNLIKVYRAKKSRPEETERKDDRGAIDSPVEATREAIKDSIKSALEANCDKSADKQ